MPGKMLDDSYPGILSGPQKQDADSDCQIVPLSKFLPALALLTAATLSAAWNYSTISGASEGAIAYRDQSGSLAVTTL